MPIRVSVPVLSFVLLFFTDIQEILDAHNNIRRKFARGEQPGFPPAADMIELQWNEELAEMSQDHADRCYRGHDGFSERFSSQHWTVNQNLGFVKSNHKIPLNYTGVIHNMLYLNEIKYLEVKDIEGLQFSYSKGHLTQMIWGYTSEVGAGACHYYWEGLYYLDVTIEYGNGGNIPGWPIYTAGPPCTQCPKNATCHHDLCLMPKKNSTKNPTDEAAIPSFKDNKPPPIKPGSIFPIPLIVGAVGAGVGIVVTVVKGAINLVKGMAPKGLSVEPELIGVSEAE